MRRVLVAGLFALLIALLWVYSGGKSTNQQTTTTANTDNATDTLPTSETNSAEHGIATLDPSPEDTGRAQNEAKPTLLETEIIEDYLAREGRTAANLLSAFHASGRTNYLVEAALQFPRDPRVQFSILSRNLFPEERRKWLDLFKSSSPDNAWPNYLSAREYLKNGVDEAGLRELATAGQKSQFQSFSNEARANEEKLQMAAGKASLDARLSARGWAEDLLGNLNTLKGLSHDVSRIHKQFASTGRAQEGMQLVEAGVALIDRIAPRPGAAFHMNQLIAWSMEAVILRGLDPAVVYAFLDGRTPQARLDEITAEKQSLDALRDLAKHAMSQMTEAEKLSFMDRQRSEGEIQALRSLGQQDGSSIPK